MDIEKKKLIVFDLDNTLAESKSQLTDGMCDLLSRLLERYSVAVISGGAWPQFEKQFLSNLLLEDELQEKLYLFPTCATSFYRYVGKQWVRIYSQDLSVEEKDKIIKAFDNCFKAVNFLVPIKPIYGEIIEDRSSQITFSALGQTAPLHLKKRWDPHHLKRLEMIEFLRGELPEFEIRSGGTTSIDVTRKNIDKAYGIRQMVQHLGFSLEEMVFIGDRLDPGGNDFPVKTTGVHCAEVENPEDTARYIEGLLARPLSQ